MTGKKAVVLKLCATYTYELRGELGRISCNNYNQQPLDRAFARQTRN